MRIIINNVLHLKIMFRNLNYHVKLITEKYQPQVKALFLQNQNIIIIMIIKTGYLFYLLAILDY